MTWKEWTLDELGHVSRGRSRHRPRDAGHLYGGPHPFFQTGDIKAAQLYLTEFSQTYSEAGLEQSKKWPAGTLCITIAANIAETAILGIDACFPDSVIGFIADEARCDVRFIKYKLDVVKRTFQQVSHGAAQDNLSQEKLLSFPLSIPEPATQRRIADILSAYDDLIENNRRRIALLEESARLLYQEWFVRLRFPGHEHVRIIDGVPEGWAHTTLGELCQIRRGASPRPIQAFMGGTVPWFKIGDATSSSSMYVFRTAEHVTEEGAKKSVLLGPGELIISNSATCGLPYFTGVTGCIHDGWLLLQPSSFASRALLYLCLQSKREELVNSVSDGSTQKNLNTEAASRLPLVFPTSDSLTRAFDTAVQPIFTQIHVLARCNDSARAARNLLLPRLMSGEVVV